MAATYEGSSGGPGGGSVGPTVTATASLPCEVDAEQEDEFHTTGAFEARERIHDSFTHLMKTSESALLERRDPADSARLAFAIISCSADANKTI